PRAALELKVGRDEVVDSDTPEGLAATKRSAMDASNAASTENPEDEIDLVHTQVDECAAPGQTRIVTPRLVRPESIVEDALHVEYVADLSGLHHPAHLPRTIGISVGVVDSEQPVRPPGRLD